MWGPHRIQMVGGFAVRRKWSNLFEGADAFIASMLGLALAAPGYTLKDVNDWIDGQGLSAEQLVPQTNALDANALGGDFAVPVFVIQGAEDFHHADQPSPRVPGLDPGPAEGLRRHRGRWPLRCIHQV